jgi:hypothetical protein
MARTGAADITVAKNNPSAAGPSIRVIRMIILRVRCRISESRLQHPVHRSFVAAGLFLFR